jgi:hypothetical protein
MRGLTLRVTNTTSTAQSFADVPSQPILGPGESRELLYTNEVQASLEYGSINALVLGGKVTVQFTNGTNLAQAAIGRTFTGATPTTVGTPGLVPTAQSANIAAYLKGDGTWTGITPTSIGAVPEAKYTTQGDLLFRGVTTTERLPLGTLGQSLRAGVVNPEWGTTTLSGALASRPSPSAYYQGVFFWATDTSALTLCYYNGTAWVWNSVGGGVPGITRKVIPSPEVVTVPDGCQYLVYDSITFLGTASMVLLGNADLVILDNPVIIPGYTRKEIPSGENVIIPNGGQYLVEGSLTLFGTATLTLQGNADLVILGTPPIPPSGPWSSVLTTAALLTNNAVAQTLATVGTTVNAANFYDITINAYRTDLSAQVAFKVYATVTNAAGAVTVRDVVITPTDPGTAWVVAVTAAAPNVLVQVTGDAGPTSVQWGLVGTALVN